MNFVAIHQSALVLIQHGKFDVVAPLSAK